MNERCFRRRAIRFCLPVLLLGLIVCGCQSFMKRFSDRLTHWDMLGQDALDDPIQAVGGDGMVFEPKEAGKPLTRKQLAAASPETLVAYYSPIFIQQRAKSGESALSLSARVRPDRRGPS